MKKMHLSVLPPIILLTVIMTSCRSGISSQNEFLNTQNIPSQRFRFDAKSDTSFRTSHGSTVKIKKGTFPEAVDIEIREVFTPLEILQSGITTISDGRPLKSGGMLYFNATIGDQVIEPLLPVSISIPAVDADTAMRLFKGEWSEDSSINWTDPVPLDTVPTSQYGEKVAHGYEIFHGKCASCHDVFRDLTGPALRNFNLRGPWRNPVNTMLFMQNPARFMQYDPYSRDLWRKFASLMVAYPDLEENVIGQLILYVNSVTPQQLAKDYRNEAKRRSISDSGHYSPCPDDTMYIPVVKSFDVYDTVVPPLVNMDTLPGERPDSNELRRMIEWSRNYQRQRYDFNIRSNGWYNVDAFLNTDENSVVKNVKLIAKVQPIENSLIHTYMVIPSERIMQQGEDIKEKNTFVFKFNEDGTVPLPLGYRAIVFSFGSAGEKILYGASEFVVANKQTINVSLKETTKESLQQILRSNNIDGVSLEAVDRKKFIYPRCDSAGFLSEPAAKAPIAGSMNK